MGAAITRGKSVNKEQFEAKMVETQKQLNIIYANEKVAYVIILSVNDEEADCVYSDLISNLVETVVPDFVRDFMRVATNLLGRGN